jgi:hypothetical protein
MLSARQKRWLHALGERDGERPKNKTVGVVGPKRCGKTLVSALALAWKSLGEDRRSVCLANSRESAQSLGFQVLGELLSRGPLEGTAEVGRGVIRFPALNSEVLALPCSARTVAGITVRAGLLVSDELWAADDPEPWRLLSSQTEGTETQTLLVSQASGTGSDVFKLWEASLAGAPGLWFDYVGPEVVAAEGHPNPFVTEEFLAERRAALPEALYRQYFLGEWGSESNAFLSPELVASCDADYTFPLTAAEWGAWKDDHAGGADVLVAAGLDRAQPFAGRDDSVLAWVAKVPGDGAPEFFVVGLRILDTGSEAEILAAVEWSDAVFGRRVPMIAETYQAADVAYRIGAELRAATVNAQVEMFSLLSRAAREGRLHWPAGTDGEPLRRQVTRFKVDSSGPTPKFSGGSQAKADDVVYATSWALLCAQGQVPTVSKYQTYFAQLLEDEPDDEATQADGD